MHAARSNLDELVTVSVRMPRALSQVLDIQASVAGRTKSDLLIGGVALLLLKGLRDCRDMFRSAVGELFPLTDTPLSKVQQ